MASAVDLALKARYIVFHPDRTRGSWLDVKHPVAICIWSLFDYPTLIIMTFVNYFALICITFAVDWALKTNCLLYRDPKDRGSNPARSTKERSFLSRMLC